MSSMIAPALAIGATVASGGTLAPILAGAGALASAAGSIAAGQQQQAAGRYNQQVQQINAGNALSTSAADTQRLQTQSQIRVAQGANLYGAQGVVASTGSPLDVLAFQATQGALDSEIARYRGDTAASSDINAGRQSAYQGDQAATAGYLKAGSTLLTSGLTYATAQNPRSSANQAIL